MHLHRRSACLAFVVASLTLPSLSWAEEYATAQDAYNAGARAINSGNLAASREPLEAALKLAKDDAYRMRVQRALLVPYRELPEIEPMQRTCEYIIAHSEQAAERSLTRGALVAFIHKRGKLPEAAKGYEERLTKDPEDRTVLYILAEAYGEQLKNPARSAELGEKLAELDKKAGKGEDVSGLAKLAQQWVKAGKPERGAELYERIAPLDPKVEAWHYKEAAQTWQKAGNTAKAISAARLSERAAPEARNDQLASFWHKGLADVFLDTGNPKEAIPHYEEAIKLTKNDSYAKTCRERLQKAKDEVK